MSSSTSAASPKRSEDRGRKAEILASFPVLMAAVHVGAGFQGVTRRSPA
jgi:hypothetical protein